MAGSDEQPAPGRRRTAQAAVGALLVLAADQASKALVRATLPLHRPREVVPGFFYLRHELNDGAAWSILRGARWPLAAVSAAVLAMLVAHRRDVLGIRRVGPWAFALLCGGELDCGEGKARSFEAGCPDGGRVRVRGELLPR